MNDPKIEELENEVERLNMQLLEFDPHFQHTAEQLRIAADMLDLMNGKDDRAVEFGGNLKLFWCGREMGEVVLDDESDLGSWVYTPKAKPELSGGRLEALFNRAIECLDAVFQSQSGKPEPILPGFLKYGEDKFDGVIKLAKAYKELAAKEK